MALYTCPDCAKQYSDIVTNCPQCARPRVTAPQPANHANHANPSWFEQNPALGALGILVAIGVVLAPVLADSKPPVSTPAIAAPAYSRSDPTPAPSPEWFGLVANIYEGTELYLKSDHGFVGTVVEISDDARFEDGSRGRGVRISFPDGSRMWMPRKTAQLLYVTKRSGPK